MRQLLDKFVDVPVFMVVSDTVEFPQLQFRGEPCSSSTRSLTSLSLQPIPRSWG